MTLPPSGYLSDFDPDDPIEQMERPKWAAHGKRHLEQVRKIWKDCEDEDQP